MIRGGQAGGRKRDVDDAWILDTHAFAFSPAFVRESGLPQKLDGTFDALVEDMDRAGVKRTIATMFVTANDDLFESVAAGLKRHPGRLAAQLNIPPNRPQWAASNLRVAKDDLRIAGARAAPSLFKLHPVDESLEQVWDACEAARLPVQLVVDGSKFCEPRTFTILARERPELALVLSLASARHRDGLAAIARQPRVFFQLPALLDGEVRGRAPSLLRWALRHLPADRLMFGSDRLGREASYFAKVEALQQVPPGVRRQVARETALEVYGARLPSWRGP